MPLLTPYHRAQAQQFNYSGRPTTTWGHTLTASATIHTLGAKVELIASTTYESEWIAVSLHSTATSAAITDLLANVYIGAAGAETVLLPNLAGGWASFPVTNSSIPVRYLFPVRVARGTRISAACQALIASDTVVITVELYGGGMDGWVGSGVEALGALTASSKGTAVTPGTTAEGTFTAIATTGRTYRYVWPRMVSNSTAVLTASIRALDVGVGGALFPGLENFVEWGMAVEVINPLGTGRYVEVPSGTALQARLQSHDTDVVAKSVIIYGVY